MSYWMIVPTILTLTLGVTLPIVAAIAIPVMRFSDGIDRIAVAAVYFTHILTLLGVLYL